VWIARRPEPAEPRLSPAGHIEGAGEVRDFRWLEVAELGDSGELRSPVRRVSSERGHIVSFEIARLPTESNAPNAPLVIIAYDEMAGVRAGAAPASGSRSMPSSAGLKGVSGDTQGVASRVLRIEVARASASVQSADSELWEPDASEAMGGLSDRGAWSIVFQAPERQALSMPRWLALSDGAEQWWLRPLDAQFRPTGPISLEPAFGGKGAKNIRLLASNSEFVFGVATDPKTMQTALQRWTCH